MIVIFVFGIGLSLHGSSSTQSDGVFLLHMLVLAGSVVGVLDQLWPRDTDEGPPTTSNSAPRRRGG